jgi:hypothetical protein
MTKGTNENVAVCKLIVDECLEHMLKPGMTADALYGQWVMDGDDFDLYASVGDDFDLYAMLNDAPSIIPARAFSAKDYAKERCAALTQEPAARLEHAAALAHQIATAPLFLLPVIDAPPIAS